MILAQNSFKPTIVQPADVNIYVNETYSFLLSDPQDQDQDDVPTIETFKVNSSQGSKFIKLNSVSREVTIRPYKLKANIGVFQVNVTLSDNRTPPLKSSYIFMVTVKTTEIPN